MVKIKELQFSKSYDEKFDCFTGYYDRQFITGSNEFGKFNITNYKDSNPITRIELQIEIEERFKNQKLAITEFE